MQVPLFLILMITSYALATTDTDAVGDEVLDNSPLLTKQSQLPTTIDRRLFYLSLRGGVTARNIRQ